MTPSHPKRLLVIATIASLIPRGVAFTSCRHYNAASAAGSANKLSMFAIDTSLSSHRDHQRQFTSDLDTSLEWLAKERQDNDDNYPIDWMDTHITIASSQSTPTDNKEETLRVPLYPLTAVYTPHSGENHTLVNTEPRNVQMASDLVAGKWGDRSLFCVTLRARDTNRLASVGTLMRLIDTEDRSISGARTWPGDILPTLNRVVVTCQAVGIVDFVNVENGYNLAESEYRIANVRLRSFTNEATKGKTEEMDSITNQIVTDYQKVRSTYINSQSLASNELPKFARKAVHELPDLTTLNDELDYWKLVDTWQVLCNTIRQAKQTQLQGVINEISVQVAMEAKGPLELPVKRRNLPENVQKQLEEMEQSAAADYVELGMEPILDFQEILSMNESLDRVRKLAAMIKRERARLEAKESLIRAFLTELE
ncbi:hypothetical protein QTG54_006040 [Skeletonema marinoi]|uniref:Lon N-terminal domain-containing protein n=1 Tax=Skeletonema marinoi TaxID=267567 RepID=A0AAD8YD69_9STRA|nr:hypothetical protein QTG54_006040 [Skeletonema marinoi]